MQQFNTYQGYNTQQPQLPYSAQQANQMGIRMVDPNNPPFTPQLQVEDFLQPWVRYAAGVAASIIVTEGTKNPANAFRIFMYNQCSNNNFMNPDFENVVSNIVNLVAFKVMLERAYTADHGGIQRAIQENAGMVCELMAVNNIRTYQGLSAYLPQEMGGKVNRLLELYDSIGGMIGQLHQWRRSQGMQVAQQPMGMMGQPGMGMPVQVHTNPQYGGFGGQPNNRFQGHYNPNNGYTPYSQPMQNQNAAFGLTGGTTNTGLLRDTPSHEYPSAQGASDAVADMFKDRWGTSSKVIEEYGPETFQPTPPESVSMAAPTMFEMTTSQVQQVETKVEVEEVEPAPVAKEEKENENRYFQWNGIEIVHGSKYDLDGHEVDLDGLEPIKVYDAKNVYDRKLNVWKPSEKYRTLPAYDPTIERLYFFVCRDDKGVIHVIPRVITMENIMPFDYSLHDARMTVLPKEFKFGTDRTNAKAVETSVKNESVIIDPGVPFELPEPFVPVLYNKTLTAATREELWKAHSAALVNTKNISGVRPQVFTTTGFVIRPVATELDDVTELVEDLRTASTVTEVHQWLLDNTEIGYIAWSEIEKALTAAVNDVITKQMCISGLHITSFYEDAPHLEEALTKTYGAEIAKSFFETAVALGKRILTPVDADVLETFRESNPGILADVLDSYFLLSERVSMTSLNCLSEELRMVIPEGGVGTNISESNNPMMRALAKRLKNNNQANRNLLRTEEGSLIELSTISYMVGDDMISEYTLSRI